MSLSNASKRDYSNNSNNMFGSNIDLVFQSQGSISLSEQHLMEDDIQISIQPSDRSPPRDRDNNNNNIVDRYGPGTNDNGDPARPRTESFSFGRFRTYSTNTELIRQINDKKENLYTELLCKRNNINNYVKRTCNLPQKDGLRKNLGKITGVYESLAKTIKVNFNLRQVAPNSDSPFRRSMTMNNCQPNISDAQDQKQKDRRRFRQKEQSMVYDQWHAIGRWYKYFEVEETAGKRWSKPHITTVCPWYIKMLRENLEVIDTSDFSHDTIMETQISRTEAIRTRRIKKEFRRRNMPVYLQKLDDENCYQQIYLDDTLDRTESDSEEETDSEFEQVEDQRRKRSDVIVEGPASRRIQRNKRERRYSGSEMGAIPQNTTEIVSTQPRQPPGSGGYDNKSLMTDSPTTSENETELPDSPRKSNIYAENPIKIQINPLRQKRKRKRIEPIKITLESRRLTWIVSGGTPEERMQVGIAIGGIFTCESYRIDPMNHNLDDIFEKIDHFLFHSTLIPMNSWDPKTRLMPLPDMGSDDEGRVPNYLDPKNNKIKNSFQSNSRSDDQESPNSNTRRNSRKAPKYQSYQIKGTNLLSDIKNKKNYYISDFIDAFNFKCIPAIIIHYFMSITQIVIFGAMIQQFTYEKMGTYETMVASGICGLIWGFTAGQPLLIVGPSAHIILFDKYLYKIFKGSKEWWYDIYQHDYLVFRFYVGVWTFLLIILVVYFKLSKLVKHVTYFTEEAMHFLVSLLFIFEGFERLFRKEKSLDCGSIVESTTKSSEVSYLESGSGETSTILQLSYYEENKLDFPNCTILLKDESNHIYNDFYHTDSKLGCLYRNSCYQTSRLYSILLGILTAILCFAFNFIKKTNILTPNLRSHLESFAVVLACGITWILSMNLEDTYVKKYDINPRDTDHLYPDPDIPEDSEYRDYKRDSILSVRHLNFSKFKDDHKKIILVFIFSILPALLLTIVIFVDQNIVALIINIKKNKLRKGAGYHLDMLVVGFLTLFCGIFGLPFIVANPVASITFVKALEVYDSRNIVPGQRAKFLGIIENRLCGIIASGLILVSITSLRMESLIPASILYGTFIFLGFHNMTHLSFIQRLLLILTPAKHRPEHDFLKNVKMRICILFIAFQIICIIMIYLVKYFDQSAVFFPLAMVACIMVRKMIGVYVFSKDEIKALDHNCVEEDEDRNLKKENIETVA